MTHRPCTLRPFLLTLVLAGAAWLPGLAHAAGVSGQGTWESTLQARDLDGNGSADAYYDTQLNVTWLADMNYANTTGYATGYSSMGLMHWDTAQTFVAGLRLGGQGGWRLPGMIDTGAPGCTWANSGTDCGYNVLTSSGATVYSELAHLYYDTLGNLADVGPSGSAQSGPGLTNTGSFVNMRNWTYWIDQTYPAAYQVYYFNMRDGSQYRSNQGGLTGVAILHDGDVGQALSSPVPEPGTWALMLVGLGGLGVVRRRGRAQAGNNGTIGPRWCHEGCSCA